MNRSMIKTIIILPGTVLVFIPAISNYFVDCERLEFPSRHNDP